jgi:hypothetical protein
LRQFYAFYFHFGNFDEFFLTFDNKFISSLNNCSFNRQGQLTSTQNSLQCLIPNKSKPFLLECSFFRVLRKKNEQKSAYAPQSNERELKATSDHVASGMR